MNIDLEIQVSLFIFTISKEQLNIDLSNGDSFDSFNNFILIILHSSFQQSNVISIFTEVSYNIQHLFKNMYKNEGSTT